MCFGREPHNAAVKATNQFSLNTQELGGHLRCVRFNRFQRVNLEYY